MILKKEQLESSKMSDKELIDLLGDVENTYEHVLDISSAAHKAERFSIAIFGSARLNSSSPEFKFVSQLTQTIVEQIQADIVTGGGPGIMAAANEGIMNTVVEQWENFQKGNKPKSYGISVHLPFEEECSPYLHVEKLHKHFTTRLQSFVSLIQGAYVCAGGIGTLLELSLIWQLRQVNHLPIEFPIVVAPVWQQI